MKDFVSLLVKDWKKLKPIAGMLSLIASICLFIVFFKRTDTDNQIIISVEQILLWIRGGIHNIIPKYIFGSIYNIVNTYYNFIFKTLTILVIVVSCIIIWLHDQCFYGKKVCKIDFKPVLWKRMGYYKSIKFTFGAGYIYYKIIEFIYLGENNISGHICEYLIIFWIFFTIIIYSVQTFFYVPDEKE